MAKIEEILLERATTHGPYTDYARVEQRLIRVIQDTPNWLQLNDVQKSCITQLTGKLARLLTGDPLFVDTARDIVGYSTIMFEHMLKANGASDVRQEKFKVGSSRNE